ncbi:uncharacterized protein KY384_007852 [Bacidia gigantensis]|uniref:uncharacterized protein n=1 Tax=Bacidia gigantensis TaxID=2732470 RepID=UPI001D04C140|nr:uncharacterized protein KY384_007852 [Bacidia gigantensis]KAG8527698.1 hypothetical protein KY384_007852 [Bacidia gigantensis]
MRFLADSILDTSISTISYTVPSTHVVNHITQYSDTVVTDASTSVTDFTSSILVTIDLAARLPSNGIPGGPGPTQSELSGATTVVYAQTVASPTNFFVYRTARIIRVPAITDSNGQLVCTTVSTFFPSTFGATPSSVLFPGVNPYAEAYFNGATATNAPAASVATDLSLSTPYLDKLPTPAIATNLPANAIPSTGGFTQNGFNGLRAATSGSLDTSESDYGWVDPFFIKFLAQQSDYLSQYPGLSTCLPGGPSIDPGRRTANLVPTPTLAPAITDTATSTTYVSGCLNTAAPECATVPPPSPTPPQPDTQAPEPSPTSVAPPPPPPSSSPPPPPPPPPSPSAPSFNPGDESPSQLSELFSALQPASTPVASPVSPPPPVSIETSPPPPVVTTSVPPSPATTLETSPSPPAVTPNPSTTPAGESRATAPTISSPSTFPGAASRDGREPLWSLLSLSLGLGILGIL